MNNNAKLWIKELKDTTGKYNQGKLYLKYVRHGVIYHSFQGVAYELAKSHGIVSDENAVLDLRPDGKDLTFYVDSNRCFLPKAVCDWLGLLGTHTSRFDLWDLETLGNMRFSTIALILETEAYRFFAENKTLHLSINV